jgi:2TM family of unknown function (DUF5676)
LGGWSTDRKEGTMNAVASTQPVGAVACEAERAPKLAVVSLASAAAIVAAVAYVVCLVLSLVAPDLLTGILQTWAHSISLAPLQAASTAFQAGPALVGLLTFSGFVWLTTAATAWLYNTCHLR